MSSHATRTFVALEGPSPAVSTHGEILVQDEAHAVVIFRDPREALAFAVAAALSQHPGDGRSSAIGVHTRAALEHGASGGLSADPGLDLARALALAAHPGQVLISQDTHEHLALAGQLRTQPWSLQDRGEHLLPGLDLRAHLWELRPEHPDHPTFPPPRTPDTSRTNLPTPASAFIGRQELLQQLGAVRARGVRLLTLLGTGGAGKTRLAVRFGAMTLPAWAGGVWFVDLAAAQEAADVTDALLAALHSPGVDPGFALRKRGETLVILDNFEHIPHLATQTVGAWLDAAPATCFLVTSRRPLMLPGETTLDIPPLPVPADTASLDQIRDNPSVALFIDRAAAVRPDLPLGPGDLTTIAGLVRDLEGLPLAIELAAARARLMTPHMMRERIVRRMDLLVGTRRGVSQRRATLRGALDATWEILAPWEQATLAQLAVFRGDFSAEAAEAAVHLGPWPEAPWIADVLQALVDHSMLRQVVRDGERRYALLLNIQAYAQEKLALAGAIPSAPHITGEVGANRSELRHGRYYARLGAVDTLDGLLTTSGAARLKALGQDHENILAALERANQRGDGATAARLAIISTWYQHFLGAAGAMGRQVAATLQLTQVPPAERSALLSLVAHAMIRAERPRAALSMAEEAEHLARGCDQARLRALALLARGAAQLALQQPAEAEASLQEAIDLAIAFGWARRQAEGVRWLGALARRRGQMGLALDHLKEAIRLYRSLGDEISEHYVVKEMGSLALARDELEDAGSWLEIARSAAQTLELPHLEALARLELAEVHRRQGGLALAQEHLQLAISLLEKGSDPAFLVTALRDMASLQEALRDPLAGESLTRAESIARHGAPPGALAQVLLAKARGLLDAQRLTDADHTLREVAQIAAEQRGGEPPPQDPELQALQRRLEAARANQPLL